LIVNGLKTWIENGKSHHFVINLYHYYDRRHLLKEDLIHLLKLIVKSIVKH
jgi:hypothetical protein